MLTCGAPTPKDSKFPRSNDLASDESPYAHLGQVPDAPSSNVFGVKGAPRRGADASEFMLPLSEAAFSFAPTSVQPIR